MMTKTVTGNRPKIEMSKAVVCLNTIGNIADKCYATDPGSTPVKANTKRTK